MLSLEKVLEMRTTAIKSINNLKAVKEHLVESKEYQLSREAQDKIYRYRRDVKILDIILDFDKPNIENIPTNIDED